MRLELPIRWTEKNEDVEKLGIIDEEPSYSYGKLSIDSEDIGPYYDIGPDYTMINDKMGKMYCVTVPFDEFKKIYTEVSGKAILAIQTREEYKRNNSRKKKGGGKNGTNPEANDEDGIDDFLDE